MGRGTEPSRILRIIWINTDHGNDGSGDRSTARLIEGDVTGQIIGAFYSVYNELRFGFLEKVYAGALEVEFQGRGMSYVRELPLEVFFKGRVVGTYRADFVVGGRVIVEVKATRQLGDADRRQLSARQVWKSASCCTLDRRPSSTEWCMCARADPR